MNRESQILAAMSKASLAEQRMLAQELESIRAARRTALRAGQEVALADAVIRDTLTPVVPRTPHTAATDWMGEIMPDHDSRDLHAKARAEATVWTKRVAAFVKEDREEFTEQATGFARKWASQFGFQATAAREAFLAQAMHLAGFRRQAGAGGGYSADDFTVDVSFDPTWDGWGFSLIGPDNKKWASGNGYASEEEAAQEGEATRDAHLRAGGSNIDLMVDTHTGAFRRQAEDGFADKVEDESPDTERPFGWDETTEGYNMEADELGLSAGAARRQHTAKRRCPSCGGSDVYDDAEMHGGHAGERSFCDDCKYSWKNRKQAGIGSDEDELTDSRCGYCGEQLTKKEQNDGGPVGACTDCRKENGKWGGGYCCDNYWVPFCDTCGDQGCPDCDWGAKENHDCARWAARTGSRKQAGIWDRSAWDDVRSRGTGLGGDEDESTPSRCEYCGQQLTKEEQNYGGFVDACTECRKGADDDEKTASLRRRTAGPMFPGGGAQIYRNDAGEVTGWDDYPDEGGDDYDDPYDRGDAAGDAEWEDGYEAGQEDFEAHGEQRLTWVRGDFVHNDFMEVGQTWVNGYIEGWMNAGGSESAVAGLLSKSSTRRTAVYLTNVGFADGIGSLVGVGTDNQGNIVKFRLSEQDAIDLKSIVLSDLSVNFSGVEVDSSDIIKDASTARRRTASDDPQSNSPLDCYNCGDRYLGKGHNREEDDLCSACSEERGLSFDGYADETDFYDDEWASARHGSVRKTASRSLSEIASEISRDWRPVDYSAAPYLSAMRQLDSINDMYGADSARTIVAYFISNSGKWRTEKAKAIKAELKAMMKSGK